MKMSPPTTTDVLVIGAGPMGLLTAIGLCQQDIDTILLGTFALNIRRNELRITSRVFCVVFTCLCVGRKGSPV